MGLFDDIKGMKEISENIKVKDENGKYITAPKKSGIFSFVKRESVAEINQRFYNNLKSVQQYKNGSFKDKLLKKHLTGFFEKVDTSYRFGNRMKVITKVEPASLFKSGHGHYVYDSEHNLIYEIKHTRADLFQGGITRFHILDSDGREIAFCHKDNSYHDDSELWNGYEKDCLTYGNNYKTDNFYRLTEPGNTILDDPIPANVLNINNGRDAFNIVYNPLPSKTFSYCPTMVYKNCMPYFRIETTAKEFGDSDNPEILFNADLDKDEAIIVFAMLLLHMQGD